MLGSPALIVAHTEGPIAFDTPWIVYSEEDERVLNVFVCKQVREAFLCFSLSKLMKSMFTQSPVHTHTLPRLFLHPAFLCKHVRRGSMLMNIGLSNCDSLALAGSSLDAVSWIHASACMESRDSKLRTCRLHHPTLVQTHT